MFRARNTGFSLIEIMVVVVIIGLLAGVVAVNVVARVEQAKRTKAKQDIASFMTALDLYKLDTGKYPSGGDGINALISGKRSYLQGKKVPKDPWGHDYVYMQPGQNGDFDIESYGPDGSDGGEEDVESWNLDKEESQ